MLHVLSLREWRGGGDALAAAAAAAAASEAGGGASSPGAFALELAAEEDLEGVGGGTVVVLGQLQDSYQQFQYQLSAKLARWVLQ